MLYLHTASASHPEGAPPPAPTEPQKYFYSPHLCVKQDYGCEVSPQEIHEKEDAPILRPSAHVCTTSLVCCRFSVSTVTEPKKCVNEVFSASDALLHTFTASSRWECFMKVGQGVVMEPGAV